MSASFNGTTSIITTPALTLGTSVTCVAWVKPSGAGEGNKGTIFAQGTSAEGRLKWQFDSSGTTKLRLLCNRVTTDGEWAFGSALSTTAWSHVAVTYDGSSTTNDPVAYLNGVSVTVTETSTPNGAMDADAVAGYVGNNSASSHTWNGLLSHVMVFTSLLTANEIALLYALGPRAKPSAYFYYPLWESVITAGDFSGNGRTGTPANVTVSAEEPPVPTTAPGTF